MLPAWSWKNLLAMALAHPKKSIMSLLAFLMMTRFIELTITFRAPDLGEFTLIPV